MTKIIDFKLKNTEIYGTNSLNSSWTEKIFGKKKVVEKIKTHIPYQNLFSKLLRHTM